SFLFYMAPITPFLALAVVYGLRDLSAVRVGPDLRERTLAPVAFGIVFTSVAVFAFFFPVLTAMITSWGAWHVRMWFLSWVQAFHELVRGHDDHEPVGGGGHDLLPGLGSVAPLDQPAVRRDLVRAVDGHVEPADLLERLHAEAQRPGGGLGLRRRAHARQVQA